MLFAGRISEPDAVLKLDGEREFVYDLPDAAALYDFTSSFGGRSKF